MTTRKLLVLIDNVVGELPAGDSVDLPSLNSVAENTILNKLILLGDATYTILGDSSIKIANGMSSFSQVFMGSITINSSGEMIVENSSSVEVIS